MRRELLVATFAASLLVPVASAQTQPKATEAAAVAAVMTPEEYIQKASVSDMFELKSGELALQKSKSEEVKKIAQQLVADHKKSSEQLAKAVKKEKIEVTMPDTLDETHQGLLSGLESASADDFDQKYMEAQMQAHEQAVALHTAYGKGGDNKALQTFAKSVRPTVKWHLDMMAKMPGA